MRDGRARSGDMRLFHRVISFTLLIIAALGGCSSFQPKADDVTASASETMRTKIEALVQNAPERAIATLTNLFEEQREQGHSFQKNVLGEEAFALFQRALENIEHSFKDALHANDVDNAVRLSYSVSSILQYCAPYDQLKALLPSGYTAIGSKEMKLQLVFLGAEKEFSERGFVAGKAKLSMALLADPALASVKRWPAFDSFTAGLFTPQEPSEYYSRWALRASKRGDIDAQHWFSSLAHSENGGTASNSTPSSVPSEKWLAQAVSSVVTVYVDRGFKIQSGYSVPDRVLGTAFQIDNGLYLTNYHVIQSEVDPSYKGYSRMSIRPSENPQIKVPAKVLGWDKEMDLALLQSEEVAKDTIFLPSDIKFQAGDRIFAVGSPVGLENSVTAGIVSSLNRKIISYGEAAQIDVPVNQGNSGSPLFSANGTLVGMVFAGLPSFQNINFALPVQWIVASLPGLFKGKETKHERLGLMLGKGSVQNPFVLTDLDPNLSAFRVGDVLKEVNGVPSKDIASIQLQLSVVPEGALCFIDAQRNFVSIRRLRPLCQDNGASLIHAWDSIQRNIILEGLMGARLLRLEDSRSAEGLYTVQWTCPAEAADELGLSENDSIKVSKFQINRNTNTIILEISAKSRSSGYFERTIHLEFSTDSATII